MCRPWPRCSAGRRVVALTGGGVQHRLGHPRLPRPRPRQARATPSSTAIVPAQTPTTRSPLLGAEPSRAGRASGPRSPTPSHHALAALERQRGRCAGSITQNVDRLHHAAGSRRVVELHGALARVCCLGCGATELPRRAAATRLLALNPASPTSARPRRPRRRRRAPRRVIAGFRVADCSRLRRGAQARRGVLRRQRAEARDHRGVVALRRGRGAAGGAAASLTVFSGYRFVLRAAERGEPRGHREPGRDPRRRARDGQGRRGRGRGPRGARRGALLRENPLRRREICHHEPWPVRPARSSRHGSGGARSCRSELRALAPRGRPYEGADLVRAAGGIEAATARRGVARVVAAVGADAPPRGQTRTAR
jgi:NAD-dependent deacetylase sirtuin 4